jgi:hypothetical protein
MGDKVMSIAKSVKYFVTVYVGFDICPKFVGCQSNGGWLLDMVKIKAEDS